jgi:hypothetical protein
VVHAGPEAVGDDVGPRGDLGGEPIGGLEREPEWVAGGIKAGCPQVYRGIEGLRAGSVDGDQPAVSRDTGDAFVDAGDR